MLQLEEHRGQGFAMLGAAGPDSTGIQSGCREWEGADGSAQPGSIQRAPAEVAQWLQPQLLPLDP